MILTLGAIVNAVSVAVQAVGSVFVTRDEVSARVKVNVAPMAFLLIAYSTTVCAIQDREPISECTRSQVQILKEIINAF